jgi:CheY-like chemotaxis protein
VLHVLRPALETLSIKLELSPGVRSGQEILLSEKFDGVIVDCDDLEGGVDLLRNLRKGTSNRNSVAFAILNGTTSTQKAFEVGANFVLQKPIQPVNATRCFTAAFGFMTRERRRYFRAPVDMPVTITFSQGEEVSAKATNLSEGGMAVKFSGKLPTSAMASVHFTLPDSQDLITPKATLAWADGSGRAGIRFVEVLQVSRDRLERWLSSKLEASEAAPMA